MNDMLSILCKSVNVNVLLAMNSHQQTIKQIKNNMSRPISYSGLSLRLRNLKVFDLAITECLELRCRKWRLTQKGLDVQETLIKIKKTIGDGNGRID